MNKVLLTSQEDLDNLIDVLVHPLDNVNCKKFPSQFPCVIVYYVDRVPSYEDPDTWYMEFITHEELELDVFTVLNPI